MFAFLSPKAWLAVLLVVLLTACGIQTLRIAQGQTELANVRTEHAHVLQGISEKANVAYQKSLASMAMWNKTLAAFDAQRTQEKENALASIESLRNDLRIGKRRLHVNASCAVGRDDLPSTPTAPGLDVAPAPRLSEDAESAYIDLRREIEVITAQVKALQDHARMPAAP
jgi:prophage endopeptidase